MNRNTLFTFAIALVAMIGLAFTTVEKTSVNVDTTESYIVWKGYKVTGSHHGKVMIKNGELNFDEAGMLTGGGFDIDMASITCDDLEGEWSQKLVGHLKSDDFFGVEKFPTAKFVITEVVSRGKPGEYKVVGDLTIKETTKKIKFNTVITEEAGKRVANADITIDRSEYNVRYGSGSFFDNLGDKTIYDEFELSVNLVAAK
ncbi:YceI family protein [Flavilitoribacter nigricans]|uniref:Lipid-binding protein n=1 Tax=Flavilitoribacter nigricans (strain ATCC 23147 / DSM 23189 / NBRC 102662 / NCIMB 1420 / SS-2) TaxID=1122177 RepID=A0A2D0N1E8_FLAN2|nr:YceI family protein [Flavilitoribacter nigricans]PHN01543.1 lipid-binding protein [Flavilitoribacter nigricans DSM 23189 = NBRC 102662]